MAWDIELTDDCRDWYLDLDDAERADVAAVIDLLELHGPHLPFP